MPSKFIAPALVAAGLLTTTASGQTTLHYDDLLRFGDAIAAIDDGVPVEQAIAAYFDAASPGLVGFAVRYDTTAERVSEAFLDRPAYYRALPSLADYVESRRAEIDAALARLVEMAPRGRAVDSYFFVADQTAGGTPLRLATQDGPTIAIGVAVDMIALSEQTDLSEFPDGTGGRASRSDLPQVVVHENAHVLQLSAQGGPQNYLSIYNPDGGNMLAIAVREGCAEYLTFLASGWRLGDRHRYGEAHEVALWEAFSEIADAPPFSVSGWFGGRHADHPDYPAQIGYWVGFRVCEYHHTSATDPDAAIADLFTLYSPDDVRPMAAAYAASLIDRPDN